MHSPGISGRIEGAGERNMKQSVFSSKFVPGHLSNSDQERCHFNQGSVSTETLKEVLKREKDLKTECWVHIC